MSKKNEFIKAFKTASGDKHPQEFNKEKDHKGFCEILNKDENVNLRVLLRDAIEEVENRPPEEAAASGLSNLFPDNM